jgi:ABC-type branched-subunit amino acid transport system substrate-binding protein
VTRAVAAALAALSLGLTACSSEGTSGGGQIVGETLTVYSLLPDTPVAQQIIDGEKLALSEAGGRAGSFKVNYAVDHLDRSDLDAVAETTRETMRDLQIITVIGDLDSETARETIPLLNEAGILHLSPGATYPGFVASFPGAPADEPERWRPSVRRTFAPLVPTDPAQAVAIAKVARGPVLLESEPGHELAGELRRRLGGSLTDDPAKARTVVYAGSDAENARGVLESLRREAPRARILLDEALLRAGLEIPEGVRAQFVTSAPAVDPALADRARQALGRCATRFTQLGHDAMKSVLAAIASQGDDARDRGRVAAAWMKANPAARTATTPFELVTDAGCTS